MTISIPSLLLFSLSLISQVSASTAADLVGTWTTKSKQVITGPGFFNPKSDRLIEPSLTGISYSFTSDGFYEEAYYRAIANPTSPDCPTGIMQWQHGSFEVNSSGYLLLTPIAVDGRQLLSEPCEDSNAVYTRYSQAETFKGFSVSTDAFHNVKRLDMEAYDGTFMNPMYIAYDPPEMLPTTTLNPTSSATSKSRAKRDLDIPEENLEPWNKDAIVKPLPAHSLDAIWWTGASLTVFGGLIYMISNYH